MVNEQPTSLRVGDYRLVARIGEGGMGVVHLAAAPDGSRVALKVLRPHVVGDDEARERLSREVASLRRVRSSRVAEIIDADPWGATPFVATRYVPGITLHEHVRREGSVRGPDLAYFATGLMEAVVAVHEVGVLHRDIKPSNVLLEGRAPVLIDFGLARLAEDPRLTQTGWLLGTPGYLAPEILYGDDATTASDVHSWAATVVFAATGRPPFGTGPAMAIMDRVRRGEHDLSAVPPALMPVVRACLAPRPADRPGTLDVLERLRRSTPTARRRVPDAPTARGDAVQVPTMPVQLATAPAPPHTRVLPAARAPYQQPPPARAAEVPPEVPAEPVLPVPVPVPQADGGSRVLLGGLLATVVLGLAAAPHLALMLLGLLVLVLRTVSWTTESADQRQRIRGRRRWYDVPLMLVSTPWYLVVATFGTLVLLVCAALVALVVGFAYLLFAGPLVPGLLLAGACVAVCLWWGPASRRVRTPTRRLAQRLAVRPGLRWLSLGVLVVAAALCAYSLLTTGVTWTPEPGSPWRPGSVAGDLLHWL